MNVLNKKMMIFGIVLFLTQNVCAMWDFGKPSLTGGYVDFEAYLQELEEPQNEQELENKETGIKESAYSRNSTYSPEMGRKEFNGTLVRTSREKKDTENNKLPSNTK